MSPLTEAEIEADALVELSRHELDIENARYLLSCSLTLPRTIPSDHADEIGQHIDELLRAANLAMALSGAAGRMAIHLITRASALLDRQREEVLVT